MQARGIPFGTAFVAKIRSLRGLFYRVSPYMVVDHPLNLPPFARPPRADSLVQLLCLDVRDEDGMLNPFGVPLNLRGDTDIEDYEGPVDIVLKVRGYSPKRTKQQNPSQVTVTALRDPKFDRGPRAIRVGEYHFDDDDE